MVFYLIEIKTKHLLRTKTENYELLLNPIFLIIK